jgi:methylmalonyl-CoA mutase N-terminal domain/subunit
MKIDPNTEEEQVRRLQQVKRARDRLQAKNCLNALQKAASEGENIVPTTLKAVKAYATAGEICETLKSVFREYKVACN